MQILEIYYSTYIKQGIKRRNDKENQSNQGRKSMSEIKSLI